MNSEAHIEDQKIDVMSMFKIIIITELQLFEVIDVRRIVADMKLVMNGRRITILRLKEIVDEILMHSWSDV
jgi:hypothetical protein